MLRLIKASNGSNGSPAACKGCGSVHFIKTGLAWHCTDCGTYVPSELKPLTNATLQKNFEQLIELHKQLRFEIDELEKIVR